MVFIRHYSQQNTTQIKEKEEGTDRQIYTVVAHINATVYLKALFWDYSSFHCILLR